MTEPQKVIADDFEYRIVQCPFCRQVDTVTVAREDQRRFVRYVVCGNNECKAQAARYSPTSDR